MSQEVQRLESEADRFKTTGGPICKNRRVFSGGIRADMGYGEDDLLPLSALQHLVFCERQCALIHIEQAWRDSALTLEGTHMHERADDSGPRRETRGDLIISRGLPLRSYELGLVGRADVVEFHRVTASGQPHEPPEPRAACAPGHAEGHGLAIPLEDARGMWVPFPVEYKRGKPKLDRCDEVQLCAQALCIEEMLDVHVPAGALFYGRTLRRQDVEINEPLRKETADTARHLHELVAAGVTPKAVREPKCEKCSMLPLCLPEAMSTRRSAVRYLQTAAYRSVHDDGGES